VGQQIKHKNRTLRVLHHDPNIFEIEHFFQIEECDQIIKCVSPDSFQPSYTDKPDHKADEVEEERTSTFARLDGSRWHNKITQRVNTFLDWDGWPIECLQLVRYEQGQFFRVHHDAGTLQETDQGQETVIDNARDTRLFTLFVYLTTHNDGGKTVFPALNLEITPKKGKAIMWPNYTEDGEPDIKTKHEGQTVGQDPKYGINIWLLARGHQESE
jgi:prolyl 4-hydroxylase